MKPSLALFIPLITLSTDAPANLLRTWQGIPGVEHTPKGRQIVSWFSGGTKEPAPENTVYLSYSDDRAGPRGGGRIFDPALWRDPGSRLWYIFNRGRFANTAAQSI